MKLLSWIVFGLLLGGGTAFAATMGSPAVVTPDNLHWVAGSGPTKGTWSAVLTGDPTKSVNSVIRVKMPDGYTNQPHYHSHPEYVTVISGAILFGTGDSINRANAKELPAGSFVMVPAGVHHWSIAKGATIVQVGGMGPLNNIPIKRGAM